MPAAFKVLQCRGFETWIEDPVWLAKARHLGYFVDLITGVGNATLTVEESWIERAIPDRMLGIRLQGASRGGDDRLKIICHAARTL